MSDAVISDERLDALVIDPSLDAFLETDAVERVVLVDAAGNAIGAHDKASVHHADTPLHLAFSCYIFDHQDRLLLTQRAFTKRTFAGVWTNSVCGHPAPGEDLRAAVMRRVRREVGVVIGMPRLVLADFSYYAEMDGVAENELCPVFVAHALGGKPPQPAPDEVEAFEWEPWSRFVQDVLSGERAVSAWCREQLQALVDLGDSPERWPDADPALLPPAVRLNSVTAKLEL